MLSILLTAYNIGGNLDFCLIFPIILTNLSTIQTSFKSLMIVLFILILSKAKLCRILCVTLYTYTLMIKTRQVSRKVLSYINTYSVRRTDELIQ